MTFSSYHFGDIRSNESPYNSRSTCPNTKVQRRGSYRDWPSNEILTIRQLDIWYRCRQDDESDTKAKMRNIGYDLFIIIPGSFQEYIVFSKFLAQDNDFPAF